MNKLFAVFLTSLMMVSFTPNKDPKPNILLIVSEDNGPDLGCYGVTEVHTPNLDELAGQGILFRNAFVTYSVCSPSRGTIYSGLYPHQNGQIGLATHNYSMYEDIKTLPVFLKEAGYRTGCIGKIHVNPESLVPWDFRPGGRLNGSNFAKKDLPLYADEAAKFINSSDSPFFLMVNYPDAHYPLQANVEGLPSVEVSSEDLPGTLPFVGADSERLREFTANYYNCMNRLDESVGMLLDVLELSGKEENTLVIYLGDHGAQFSRGKCSNYEAGLKVPFLMKWTGNIPRDQERNELISTIDLLPTILEVAGIEIPDYLPGRSLAALYNGNQEVEWPHYIFADGAGSAAQFCFPRRSVRSEQYKLIHNLIQDRDNPHYDKYVNQLNVHFSGGTGLEEISASPGDIQEAYKTWKNPPEFELYDLSGDPYEFHDLSGDPDFAEELESLKSKLHDWQLSTNDPFLDKDVLQRYVQENDDNLNTPPKSIKWEYHKYFQEKGISSPVDVFVAGKESITGVEDAPEQYAQFREQNIVVTNSGTIVAVCQARNKSSWSDRSGQDLVVKTSIDNGLSWSRASLIATHGLKSICPNAAVYDKETDQIHVVYNLFMWDYDKKPTDVVGELKDNYSRQFIISSDDDGESWTEPREISDMVQTHGAVMVVGSGEGIQLQYGPKKGRLIIAGGDFDEGKKVLCFFSDDHGLTWERSEVVPWEGEMSWASESKLAELPDGTLVLNSRTFVKDGAKSRLRTRAFSKDGGTSWTKLENDPALKTVSCNGSLISVNHPEGEQNSILLCSVPIGPGRTHGTVYISFDGGKTWPQSKCIVPTAFAYSSLIELPDGKIGLFYEARGHKDVKMVKLTLEWLLETDTVDNLALFKYEHEGVKQFDSQQEKDAHSLRMGWWREAKLGLFLHWGIYSVPAGSWNGKKTMGNGEWIMNGLRIPVKEYEKFATQFNPKKFDAEAWVKFAHESGVGYIVITAKHHDGFAMYHSEVSEYNVVDATPFKRDPMKELAEACNKYGIKLCFYYSQDIDWHHPGGHGNNWDYNKDDFKANVDKYYEEKCLPQIRELCTNYGNIGAFWFDTPRSISKHWSEKIYEVIRELQPNCIMNSRLGNNTGDYLIAGERGFPSWKVPGVDWEHCQTINKSWGYNANLEDESYWLPTDMLLRNLACMTSYGGNYLLNVGPDKDGNFPGKAVRVFSGLSGWMNVNRESINKASQTPFPQGQPWGAITSKTGKLFLHIFEWPENNTLVLTGLKNKVSSVKIIEGNRELRFKQNNNKGAPQLSINLPEKAPDEINTVIQLEIDGKAEISPYAIQNEITGLLSVDGHLFHGEDGALEAQAFFGQKGEYKVEVHSLHNFWGRESGWTGGQQDGTMTVDRTSFSFNLQSDSIYKKSWFSYSPIVKSEIGKIRITEQGLQTIYLDGINIYHGVNMGPNHHKEGLKLHYVRFIKINK